MATPKLHVPVVGTASTTVSVVRKNGFAGSVQFRIGDIHGAFSDPFHAIWDPQRTEGSSATLFVNNGSPACADVQVAAYAIADATNHCGVAFTVEAP